MKSARAAVPLAVVLATGACGARACGGLGGRPPAPLPEVRSPDGTRYSLLDKGRYKAYYDSLGQLARIEEDTNGDGRADRIAHYGPGQTVFLVEVDEDHDAWVDRWEYYDPSGTLVKVGRSRHTKGRADVWTFPGPDGHPVRVEYDDDGDGLVDRAEVLRGGEVVGVEMDSDRNGRMDRWQTWDKGRLRREELDTDGDGKPDRRLLFDGFGKVLASEAIRP
jgi:hypothetical protein